MYNTCMDKNTTGTIERWTNVYAIAVENADTVSMAR